LADGLADAWPLVLADRVFWAGPTAADDAAGDEESITKPWVTIPVDIILRKMTDTYIAKTSGLQL